MLNNRNNFNGNRSKISKIERADTLSISPLSIAEKVRSRIPSKTCKYDKNDKIDEIYRNWSKSTKHMSDSPYDQIIFLFYDLYRPRIVSIAKSYRSLSPIFDDDDLLQTGLFGIFQALVKYDHAEHISMKFSTYLEWSIRNIFQRTIGCNDKLVEIYDGNDQFQCIMHYQEFLTKKKSLLSSGHMYIIKSKQCYLSDESLETHAFVSASRKNRKWANDNYDSMPGEDSNECQ